MVTLVPNSCTGRVIPKSAFEAVAEVLLPMIREYYATEEGRRAFAEWKANQPEAKKIHYNETIKGEAVTASPLSHKLTLSKNQIITRIHCLVVV